VIVSNDSSSSANPACRDESALFIAVPEQAEQQDGRAAEPAAHGPDEAAPSEHPFETSHLVASPSAAHFPADSLGLLDFDTMQLISDESAKNCRVDLSPYFQGQAQVLKVHISDCQVSLQ
jgi:hypothetical protein